LDEKYLKILNSYKLLEEEFAKSNYRDVEIQKKLKKLKPLYQEVSALRDLKEELDALENSPFEEELKELYEEEKEKLKAKITETEERIEKILKKSPFEGRNIIVEIRAGTGGVEASLFAGDLFRMYQKVAGKNSIKIDILSFHPTQMNGIKEVVFEAKGEKAFYYFRFEGGVHRVQRIPVTESGGRIHTSAASVAVYPEPEDVEVEIKNEELKIDTFRASGKGGQHVNKTDSAVRITHIPTGIVVSCQDERSQHQNKQKALLMLRAKLYDKVLSQSKESIKELVRSQVRTQDRSEKIRTYNFPQNRVTDHRINYTIYNLDEFLNGEVDELVEELWKKLG